MLNSKYISYLIITITVLAFSETSAFSAVSIGDIDVSLSSSTGIALNDSLVIKNHNYASWTGIANTTFSISSSYSINSVEDISGNNSDYDRFSFEDLSFAMPFGNGHIFGFSYYPAAVSDISGVSGPELVENSFEEAVSRTLETKKGSISNASLIYGKHFSGFAFAADASFKFGNYNRTKRYNYTSVSETYLTDNYFEEREITQISHFTLGSGVIYDHSSGLSFGAKISLPVSSSGTGIYQFDRTTSYGSVLEKIYENTGGLSVVEWPVEYGAGLGYRTSGFVFSYDFVLKKFDGLKTGIDDTAMSDYYRHVIGLRYAPRQRRYDPYLKRMAYSGYLTIEKRPFDYNGNPVFDTTGTLGLNFPFNNDRTNVEIKFSYIRSGSVSDNALEGNTFRMQFNFISSDSWWLKKEKYND
ncbi:MAG: hypothetical protein JXN63_03045 [Candidatus Delongbacteria bacterium]|nr:hypothetical protein [Candidatus Delongbacteria bacterium]